MPWKRQYWADLNQLAWKMREKILINYRLSYSAISSEKGFVIGKRQQD
jgi:hypothetical protein